MVWRSPPAPPRVVQRADFFAAELAGDTALELLRTGFDRVVLVMIGLALLSALVTALAPTRTHGANRGRA